MYRIDDATAASSLPAPEAAATEGFFTEGNPAAGTPATKVRGSWLNMIQEELASILTAAGIVRNKTTYNQVNAAMRSMYSSVVGSVRNLSMSVGAASASATMTADEIIVETALGGQTYRLASFNRTINLATTGAGGMDTGVAPTSGYVAIYAIYNPTTQTTSLLATNAATLQPNVYGGANMPAGYTASALVSVWPTNASKLFIAGLQIDRMISFSSTAALGTTTPQATFTSLSIAGIVPANAKSVAGSIALSLGTSAGSIGLSVSGSTSGIGAMPLSPTLGASQGMFVGFPRVSLGTPQTIYYTSSISSGTGQFAINLSSYEF